MFTTAEEPVFNLIGPFSVLQLYCSLMTRTNDCAMWYMKTVQHAKVVLCRGKPFTYWPISNSTVSGRRFCLFHMTGLISVLGIQKHQLSREFSTSIQVKCLQVDRRIIHCFLSISDVTFTVLKVNQHCVFSFLNHRWDWFCFILLKRQCTTTLYTVHAKYTPYCPILMSYDIHGWRKFIFCCHYFHFQRLKSQILSKNL